MSNLSILQQGYRPEHDWGVQTLHSMDGGFHLPYAPPWLQGFITSWLPPVICVIGTVVAIIVLILLMRKQKLPTTPPSIIPPLVIAIISLLLVVLGLWQVRQSYLEGTLIYKKALAHLVKDFRRLDSKIHASSSASANSLGNISALEDSCRYCHWSCEKKVREVQDTLSPKFILVNAALNSTLGMTQGVEDALEILNSNFSILWGILWTLIVAPTVLAVNVLLYIGIILIVALRCRYTFRTLGGEKTWRFCVSIPLAMFVMFLTCITAFIVQYAISIASFCVAPRDRAEDFLEGLHQNSTETKELVDYYLTGNGSNPLLKELQPVRAMISTLESPLVTLSTKAVGKLCPAIVDADLPGLASVLKDVLDIVIRKISFKHFYNKYYSLVVNDKLCGVTLETASWLTLIQLPNALILLPAICLLANKIILYYDETWPRDVKRIAAEEDSEKSSKSRRKRRTKLASSEEAVAVLAPAPISETTLTQATAAPPLYFLAAPLYALPQQAARYMSVQTNSAPTMSYAAVVPTFQTHVSTIATPSYAALPVCTAAANYAAIPAAYT